MNSIQQESMTATPEQQPERIQAVTQENEQQVTEEINIQPEDQARMEVLGGSVYTQRPVDMAMQILFSKIAMSAHVIEILVHPSNSDDKITSVLRKYFALTSAQAVAKAMELEVRLGECQLNPCIVNIRQATKEEIEFFFEALDQYEVVIDSANPSPRKKSSSTLQKLLKGGDTIE